MARTGLAAEESSEVPDPTRERPHPPSFYCPLAGSMEDLGFWMHADGGQTQVQSSDTHRVLVGVYGSRLEGRVACISTR